MRDDVFRGDQKRYNKRLPESLSKEADDSREGPNLVRRPGLGKFVLDALLEHGKKIWKDHKQKLELKAPCTSNDPDILRPYDEAIIAFTSPPYSEQLEILRKHVQEYKHKWSKLGRFSRAPASPSAKALADAKEKQGLAVADIKKGFAAGPPPESIRDLYSLPRGWRMVREIKASIAYSAGEKFALEVAFHDICALKASSDGNEYPVHGKFRDVTLVSSSVARRYNAQKATRGSEPR